MKFNFKGFIMWLLVAAFAGLLFNEVFAQTLRTEKVDIITTNDPARTYVELDATKDWVMQGDLLLGPNAVNVINQLKYNGGTGLVSGGTCSINGGDNSKFDISAGVGIKVNGTLVPVTWSAFSAQTVTNLATAEVSYIYIDDTGAIVQQTTEPTPASRRNDIFLCRLVHPDNTTIVAAGNRPDISIDLGNQFGDLVRALGLIRVSGLGVSPATLLQFNTAAGTVFNIGSNFANNDEDPHYIDTAAQTPTSFTYVTQASGSSAAATSIDPTQYDNAGVLTAIGGSPNSATIQRVFVFPSGQIYVQYGQTVYPSLADALAGIGGSTFIPNPNILGEALAIGAWVVTRSCTDLNTASCARFVTTSKLGDFPTSGSGAVVTLQNAYNASTAGTITLDSTRGAVKIADAATPTGGNLFSVVNNALSVWYFRVTASLAEFFDNLQITANEIATVTGDINFAPGTGILTKTDANANTVTLGSNNPELANKMEYPSFEEGISSQVTCTGCTGGALTRVASNTHGSWAAQAAYAGATGAIDIVVPAAELLNMPVEVSCYVTTPATATDVWFVAQRNGADTPFERQIPAGTTTKLAGIYLGAGGGSTSTGMQIDIRTAVTGNIVLDDCSVGTNLRATDISNMVPISEPFSCTPTFPTTAFGTPSNVNFKCHQEGKFLVINGAFTTGTTDGNTAALALPSGYTIDHSYHTYTGGQDSRGIYFVGASTALKGGAMLVSAASTQIFFGAAGTFGSNTLNPLSAAAGTSIAGTGDVIQIQNLRLPVKEFSASSTVLTLGPDNFTGLTGWKSYDPVFSAGFGTVSTYEARYRRVGDSLEVALWFVAGTTTTGLGSISLPAGLSLDTTKLRNNDTTGSSSGVGRYDRDNAVAGGFHGVIVTAPATDTGVVYIAGQYADAQNHIVPAANVNTNISTGQAVGVRFTVPIEGWDQGAAVVEVIRPKVCVLTDQKGSGTAGGASSATTWNPRILNTAVGDCDFVTLSNGTTGTDGTANRFTVLRGTYQIACSAPAFGVQLHQLRIVEDPAGSVATVFNGNGAYARSASDASSNMSEAEGTATFTASTVLQLQHYTQSASAVGLGLAVSSGVSQYFARCTITKLQ